MRKQMLREKWQPRTLWSASDWTGTVPTYLGYLIKYLLITVLFFFFYWSPSPGPFQCLGQREATTSLLWVSKTIDTEGDSILGPSCPILLFSSSSERWRDFLESIISAELGLEPRCGSLSFSSSDSHGSHGIKDAGRARSGFQAIGPQLLGTKDQFCGWQISMDWGWGGGFRMIQMHNIYWALYF